MKKTVNIVLITILLCVTVWSIFTKNWYILVANIAIISGVMLDDKATKLLMQENVNILLIRRIQKIIVPLLYVIGAISLILFGFNRFQNPIY